MQASYVRGGDSIPHTAGSAIVAGQVVVLGTRLITVAKLNFRANLAGTAWDGDLHVRGTFSVVKVTGAITKGVALYWDADADPLGGTAGTGALTTNSALGPFAGFAAAAAASDATTVQLNLMSLDAGATTLRSALGQDDLAIYAVPVTSMRVHDAMHTVLPGTAANDDMAIITGTPGTDAPTLQGVDFGGTSTDEKCAFEFVLPPEYVAGETVVCRLTAAMITAVSDGTATVDVEAWETTKAGAVGADICATAAQSINSLTAADKDFVLTPTSLVAGDKLIVRLSFAGSDTGNLAVMIPEISSVQMLLDIKG